MKDNMTRFFGILVSVMIMLALLIIPIQPVMAATAPVVVTQPASYYSNDSVNFGGRLTSIGTATSVDVSFEYGPTTAYGQTTPSQPIVANGTNFNSTVTGLQPIMEWHYRAKAVGDGTAYGPDVTVNMAPSVYTSNPSLITASAARLNGYMSKILFPQTNASFVWGTAPGGPYPNTTGQQLITPEQRDSGGAVFSTQITGLAANTTYYFKAKADVTGGTSYGAEKSFSTSSSTPTDKIVFEYLGGISVWDPAANSLTRLREMGEAPCWSQDGTKIVYTSSGGIYIMNADGSNQHFVTNGSNPVFSPDGTKIAFDGIQVINIDGTGMTQLASGSDPDWTPDGTSIYYSVRLPSSLHYGLDEIFVMNSDGSNPTQLTYSPDPESEYFQNCMNPACSPDNSKVIYHRENQPGLMPSSRIYSMNSDGTNNILLGEFTGSSSLDWSSDSTRIVYSSWLGVQPNGLNSGIYTMKADASDRYFLAYGANPSVSGPSSIPSVNHPPVLSLIGNKSVVKGQILTFTVNATDADSDPLTFSVANLPSGATFNTTSHVFSWTPTATGIYPGMIFSVSDGKVSSSETISIAVTEGTGITVNLSIILQGGSRPAAGWIIPLTVKFFTPGANVLTATPVYLFTPITTKSDTTAVAQVSGVVAGNYDISVVSAHTLINEKQNVAIAGPTTAVNMGTLLEGNANDDNIINIQDFGILVASYLKSTGAAGFDPRADFDRSGLVNIADFGLLVSNYLKTSPVIVP